MTEQTGLFAEPPRQLDPETAKRLPPSGADAIDPAQWTADQVDAMAHLCLVKRDMQGVTYCLRMLAVRDPDRAQAWLDMIEIAGALRENA